MQNSISTLFLKLREDTLLLVLLAGLVLSSVIAPGQISTYASLVDWSTVAALTGLLLLTKGLEVSGALRQIGYSLVSLMATERTTALCLVAAAALLSTFLTNDVALLVVVPLTLGVGRITKLPTIKLVVFEALAVNAGSALTPIGNPQNLFLWQLSKIPFGTFVWHMLPLVGLMMAALLVLTACAFAGRPVLLCDDSKFAPVDRPLLGISLGLYVPFLVAIDLHHAGAAVVLIVTAFIVLRPSVLAQLDYGLLLVFVLMFIDLRLLTRLQLVRDAMQGLALEKSTHLYFGSIGASQFLSNVPAAIALGKVCKTRRQGASLA